MRRGHVECPGVLPFEAECVKRNQWIIWLGLERTYSEFEVVLEGVALGIGYVLIINVYIWVSGTRRTAFKKSRGTGDGKSPLRPLRTAKQRVDAACSSPSRRIELSPETEQGHD